MNEKSKSTLKNYEKNLRFKKYSENTITNYLNHLKIFLINFNYDPYHISQKEAVNYLINKEYTSISQQNQYISSIKLFFKFIRNSKLEQFNIERPRKEKKLPRIIDHNYLKKSINNIKNIKHKAIITLTYSTGMRVSEVINLKISDIDSNKMIIYIKNAKFKKDRIVPLSKNTLSLLRNYYKKYKPKEYIFNGQFLNQYSKTSCNKIIKKYIGKNYHMHLLRHSYATYLLEKDVDIRYIKELLGNNSIKTTEIYTHINTNKLQNIKTPI